VKTLVKLAVPLIVIAVAALIRWRRRLSWRDDVGIRPAPAGVTIAWMAGYAVWMLATNAAMDWRGPWDFTPWRTAPILVDAGRVLAVSILGPIAEELLFRGVLFGVLVRRFPVAPVIVVLAIVWSLLHVSYDWSVIALIFVDGLILGVARDRTRSVIPPMLMHIAWNLYAIW
jgi:membrane protease YdiL (CAAX protease family)